MIQQVIHTMKIDDLLYRMYTGSGTSLDDAMKEANESYNVGFYHNIKSGYFVDGVESQALYADGVYHYIIKVIWRIEKTVSSARQINL